MSNYSDFTGSFKAGNVTNKFTLKIKPIDYERVGGYNDDTSLSVPNNTHTRFFMCCLSLDNVSRHHYFTNAKLIFPVEARGLDVTTYVLRTHLKNEKDPYVQFDSSALRHFDYNASGVDIISRNTIDAANFQSDICFVSVDISQCLNEAMQQNLSNIWFRVGFACSGNDSLLVYSPLYLSNIAYIYDNYASDMENVYGFDQLNLDINNVELRNGVYNIILDNLVFLEYKIRRYEENYFPFKSILNTCGNLLCNINNFDLMFLTPQVTSNNEMMPISYSMAIKQNRNKVLTQFSYFYQYSYEIINDLEIAITNYTGQKTIFTRAYTHNYTEDDEYFYIADVYVNRNSGEVLYHQLNNDVLILKSGDKYIEFSYLTNDNLRIKKIGTDFDDYKIKVLDSKLLMEFNYSFSNNLENIELYGDKTEDLENQTYSGLIERMTISRTDVTDINGFYLTLHFETEQKYVRYVFDGNSGNVLLTEIKESYDSNFENCTYKYLYDFTSNLKITNTQDNTKVRISRTDNQLLIDFEKGSVGYQKFTRLGNTITIESSGEDDVVIVLDELGKVKETYCEETNTGQITLNNKDVNNCCLASQFNITKFENNFFPSFSEEIISEMEDITNEFCPRIIGNTIHKFTPSENNISFTKTISYNGKAKDTFEFCLILKTFLNYTNYMNIKVRFLQHNLLVREFVSKATILYDDFQGIYESVCILHPFNKIEFTFETDSRNVFYLSDFFIQKGILKKVNTYSEDNKILDQNLSGKEIRYLYDENELVGIKTSAGEDIDISGDKYSQQTMTINNTNSKIVQTLNQYRRKRTTNTNFKNKINDTVYNYNDYNDCTQQMTNGKLTHSNFDRDTCTQTISKTILGKTISDISQYENGLLKSKQMKSVESNQTKQSEIDYNYIEDGAMGGRTNEIIINNFKYKLLNDVYNRLRKVEAEGSNTNVLNEFTYYDENGVLTEKINLCNEFENIYLNNELILTKLQNKAIKYIYNDQATINKFKKLVKTVLYGDILDNASNNYLDVIEIDNGKYLGVVKTSTFDYDNFGNIINITEDYLEDSESSNLFDYYYDNKNELKSKRYRLFNTDRSIIYENNNDSKRNGLSGMLENISYSSFNDYLYPSKNYSLMFGEKCDNENIVFNYDKEIKAQLYTLKNSNAYFQIPLANINKYRNDYKTYNDRTFVKEDFNSQFLNNKSVNLIFRLSERTDINESEVHNYINLLTLYKEKTDDENEISSFIFLRLNCSNNCLELHKDFTDSYYLNQKVSLNQWHCITITIDNSIKLLLDGYEVFNLDLGNYTMCNNLNIVTFGKVATITDNTDYTTNTFTTNKYNYEVLYSSVGAEKLFDKNNFNAFTELYSCINNNGYNNRTNTVIYNNTANNITLVPLNGTVDSIIQPIIFDVRNISDVNITSNYFYYEKELKRLVYCSKLDNQSESLLGYNLQLNNNVLLYFRFKPLSFDSSGYIFSVHTYNNQFKWGIVQNEQKRISIVYYDESLQHNLTKKTNLYLEDNCWHDLFVRIDGNIIEISLDNETFAFYNNPFASLADCLIYIGSSVDYIESEDNLVKNPAFNLNGFFDCFGYKDETNNEIINLDLVKDDFKVISISQDLDFENRLKENHINSSTKQLKHYYQYYDDTYINELPTCEFTVDNETIYYKYDDLGNIISKTFEKNDGTFIERFTYEYDYLNQLIKETKYVPSGTNIVKSYQISYTYDNHGNLLTKSHTNNSNVTSTTTFSYGDSENQYMYENVLSQVISDDKVISLQYNSLKGPSSIVVNDLVNNTISNNLLQWENNRLSRYNNTLFEYNEYGQRIKKYNENSTTKYYYENDLLITSIKDNVSVDYLHDNNNLLFGFIFDNKDYYYLRDITGNINKIVDSNGLVMVKYTYTAYGQVTIDNMFDTNNPLYQTAEELITHNIFLYKGYCYDVETGLFWLSSRYYSPELCRFISPDSVDYLDPSSINGLNLYSYCGNDPINKYDPSGHSAILIGMLIGLGVGALIGGGFEIAKQAYNGGDWNWDMSSWNWGQIGLSALGGAVAGAISSISFGSGVVGYLTTFATGGVGSVLGGMISGSVTDLQSGLIAFGIGAVANVAARGITALINKGVSASAQKALSNPIFDDLTLGDLVGSGLKNNGYAPAYNKFLNYAGNLVLKANGQWARSSMYSFANVGISSLLSGWY